MLNINVSDLNILRKVCAVGFTTLYFCIFQRIGSDNKQTRPTGAKSGTLQKRVGQFSAIRSGFDTRPVHVGFLMEKVAVGQVSLPVLQFSH